MQTSFKLTPVLLSAAGGAAAAAILGFTLGGWVTGSKANATATNKAAAALYRKLGFKEFATLPKWLFHKGEYIDHVFMRL